jgi:hypothetical protein
MPFEEKKRLDPSQVQDRRGRSMGRTIAVGGGGIGLILLIASLVLGVDLTGLAGISQPDPSSSEYNAEDIISECQTGADANLRQDCRLVGFVNSIQAFWSDELESYGIEYIPAQTVLFSGETQAACGFASGASGPFYCPTDQQIYIDLAFFETIESRFGAQGGPLAEAYVIAHEYGHHIQNILGILNTTGMIRDSGPESEIVLTELQADCLAGVWMANATATGYLQPLSREEIFQALDAAVSVGDDRIQQQTQGHVVPDAWTHGSSEQRLAALQDGLNSGDVNTCDTPGW